MTRDYSNYGSKIEQIRGEGFNGESGREMPDIAVCSGVIDGIHCPVRVSCLRYQSCRVESTEFVRATNFEHKGHKDLGCDQYRWVMPDDSKSRILTFEKAVRKYAE